ncbi:MAG TPA: glycosyltransferase [Acidimicrobiales bacterium]|nr:glycosyltransferase [Acidimicrobiales bacterium]
MEQPWPTIEVEGPDGLRFTRAWVLVRRAGRPLGLARISLDGPIGGDELRAAVAAEVDLDSPADPPPTSAAPLTAVVCSIFARYEELHLAVASLMASDHPALEVLVVDNRLHADRAQHEGLLAAHPGPLRIVHEPRVGLSPARNRGAAEATTELVAFTDDDVQVDPAWASVLSGVFAARPEVDCVTGVVLPDDLVTEVQVVFEEFFGGFNRSFRPAVYGLVATDGDPFHPFAPGRFGTGANMAYRRQKLLELGGFDERLGPGTPTRGGEDLAAFVRLLLAGGRLATEPAALVRHNHPTEMSELTERIDGYGKGLTAMLTSVAVTDPRHALAMARRAPTAARRLLGSGGGTVAARPPKVRLPRGLRARHLAGMLAGPVAYARSRPPAPVVG